jgi:hypothetical protein
MGSNSTVAAMRPIHQIPSNLTVQVNGTPWDLGTIPGNYAATSIRFYKLSYDPTRTISGVTKYGVYPRFLSGSGNYTSRSDITQFMTDLWSNTLGNPDYPIDASIAPSINLDNKSYIVVQLDNNYEWTFLQNETAVKTGGDLTAKYFGLAHYASGSNQPQNTAPSSCKVISFATGLPAAAALGRYDSFNFYLGFDTSVGTIPMIMDPEIKNRGGTGPGQ